jgi:hypothetical protein
MMQRYLMYASQGKYTKEQAIKILMNEPTIFLEPLPFTIFKHDSGLNLSLHDYATVIMKQAKQKQNHKLFRLAKDAYNIGRKLDI